MVLHEKAPAAVVQMDGVVCLIGNTKPLMIQTPLMYAAAMKKLKMV
jgi:hypothetical protein